MGASRDISELEADDSRPPSRNTTKHYYKKKTMQNEDDKRHHRQNNDEESSSSSDSGHGLSSEAAGVVRGISRTIARGIAKSPLVGRLPQPAAAAKSASRLLRQHVPIKQVARVSDRVSTSLDWWSTAAQVHERSTWGRLRAFTLNLVKNTVLGMVVFETYGYLVGQLAPAEFDGNDEDARVYQQQHVLVDDETEKVLIDEPDEFARASLLAHFGAGSVAGSLHGLLSSTLERHHGQGFVRHTVLNTLHHSLAHSLLFTTYEASKRLILEQLHQVDHQTTYFGGAYLTAFGIAGGVAGQVQHAVSHYTEIRLGLTVSALQLRQLQSIPPPALLPTLYAFPPSAIGFIAFEYGKKFIS